MPAFACGLCHHLCGSDRFDVGMKSVLWAGSVSLGWAQLMWKQQKRKTDSESDEQQQGPRCEEVPV